MAHNEGIYKSQVHTIKGLCKKNEHFPTNHLTTHLKALKKEILSQKSKCEEINYFKAVKINKL